LLNFTHWIQIREGSHEFSCPVKPNLARWRVDFMRNPCRQNEIHLNKPVGSIAWFAIASFHFKSDDPGSIEIIFYVCQSFEVSWDMWDVIGRVEKCCSTVGPFWRSRTADRHWRYSDRRVWTIEPRFAANWYNTNYLPIDYRGQREISAETSTLSY
jgi:hypothetical protein